MNGVTGENLMVLLESRLDNVVFRLGFARTRREARQTVTSRPLHGEWPARVDIPSATSSSPATSSLWARSSVTSSPSRRP